MRRILFALILVTAACGNTTTNNADFAVSLDSAVFDLLVATCPPCSGATALCDHKTLQCVACLSDSDCAAGSLCAGGSCHAGCSLGSPSCAPDGGSCDVDLGICRGCLSDSECPLATPRCDASDQRCVTCLPTNDNCALGSYCVAKNGGYACEPGCKSQSDCQALADGGAGGADGGGDGGVAGPECCNHVCADTSNSAANCGSCGNACNGGQCCGGACVDPTGDVANCGGCGIVCTAANGTSKCAGARCLVLSCLPGFGDCNGVGADGCETNTQADAKNCNGCGKACPVGPHASAACTAGACSFLCDPGYADCDGNQYNGCEVNTQTDAANCGACHAACNVANGFAGCAAGKCTVASCDTGYADCDGSFTNGCEVNTTTDVNNCGACQTTCNVGPDVNGVACASGTCALTACAANYKDCDGKFTNGCEVNVTTDLANCGACNAACVVGANVATEVCSAGTCKLGTCKTGFADCDANAANGCEVNTTNDLNNCGGCAKKCPSYNGCVSSACSPATLIATWSGVSFYKVPVVGVMSDTNVFNACAAYGLHAPCGSDVVGCTYNDNLCKISTPETDCTNPMEGLSHFLCGANISPSACAPLYGVFQYMGQKWINLGSCGAAAGSWCVQGSTVSNMFALCIP